MLNKSLEGTGAPGETAPHRAAKGNYSLTGGTKFSAGEVSHWYSARVPDIKQQGDEWRGPCPVHQGKGDNFAVDPQTGQAYCHSQCARGWDILELEQELTSKDFKEALAEVTRIIGRETRQGRKANTAGLIVAEYDYTDESGGLLFQCVRFDPKDFRQRRPGGHGSSWIWNLKGVRLVPYRLPKILAAQTVYIVEGERDVHTLEDLELVATCNPMGAGKWRPEYAQYFRGKDVVVIPDQDAPGARHGRIVARSLASIAASIRLINLPRGKDVTEWKEQGGTSEELRGLVQQAEPFTAPADDSPELFNVNTSGGLVQDIEQAIKQDNHFARDEGDLLYHFEMGVYRPTGERFIRHAVKRYCEEKDKTKSWSPELAAKLVAYVTVDVPELWERPPLDTVNVANGLLDVNTRVLRPHSPEFLSPVQIHVAFDPHARCPAVDQFVSEVFPADAQHTPWELAAWLMLPDTSIQKAVLALGEGANGKSVFLGLLQSFIGRQNCSALSLHKIESDKFAAARLVGKLANICPDLPTVALCGTSMFKALTGGDTITGERKFQSSFEFRPYSRLVFSANSAPRSDDATHGFFRRWLVIPFSRIFDEADSRTVPRAVLDARLSEPAELSGILNRALKALPQIQAGTFRESASMRAAWEDFRRTTDPLAVWLDANTVDVPEGMIPKEKLRMLYTEDCRDAGRPILPGPAFTERLRRLRPRVAGAQRTVEGRPRTWCFVGIGLRMNQEPGQFAF